MRYILAILLVLAISSMASAEKTIKIKYPSTNNVSALSSLSCNAVMYAGIWGELDGIEGQIEEAKDILAIKIKDDETMLLITKASVEVGIAEPAEFQIVKNDKEVLLAVEYHESALGSPSLGTFILNKETGLAIWTRNEPTYMLLGKPVTQSHYLICK